MFFAMLRFNFQKQKTTKLSFFRAGFSPCPDQLNLSSESALPLSESNVLIIPTQIAQRVHTTHTVKVINTPNIIPSMRNNKAQGLSISTLVIIALAVFVIFLVIGFVTSGWSFFTSKFGAVKGEELDAARIKCNTICASYTAQGSPEIGPEDTWDVALCQARTDFDLNNDGIKDDFDEFTCRGSAGTSYDKVVTAGQCPAICP